MYSQVSLKRMVFVIHSMFKRTVDKKWLSDNPFEDTRYQAPASKKVTEDIEGLTAEELKEFLGIIKQYPVIYNPIMVMLNTGMRTQEAIALKWGDIDFKNNMLYVRQAATMTVEFDEEGKIKKRHSVISCPKTLGSKRDIGLTPEARDILLAWREEAPSISKTKLVMMILSLDMKKSPVLHTVLLGIG